MTMGVPDEGFDDDVLPLRVRALTIRKTRITSCLIDRALAARLGARPAVHVCPAALDCISDFHHPTP
jgi:hypothetical protein